MDKLKFETPDMVAGNIEKIGALFPAAITEMRDEDGQIKKGINFEVLKQLLSRDVVDGDECYEFTWVGKKAAMAEAARPITKTLRPVKEDSRDWDTTQNLYIEGDNLEVLKILQESYLGKVKMIYIDPPYNTGHDFIYRDKFQRSQQEENEQMGMYDEAENQMFENTESNGRFHSDWCSGIYSRLVLARNLLADDGVIFISIDDNELDNLIKIASEVFGRQNYEACVTWRRRTNQPNDKSKMIAKVAENIIVFAKNSVILADQKAFHGVPLSDERKKEYKNPDNDVRGPWSTNPWKAAVGRGGTRYSITTPTGKTYTETWYGNLDTFNSLVKDNRVHWTDEGNGYPRIKIYLSDAEKDGQAAINFFTHERFGSNQEGSAEVESLFKQKGLFDNPKPTRLLKSLALLASSNNSIILDFFSGSATTAHAVMQLNAEDGGHRKFIMVQLPEPCDEKSEAFKAGYKNICEIGKERIRRAGDKIKEDNPLGTQGLDIGFRVFRVDSSNMKDVYYQPEELDQQSIFNLVSNIKDDRTDMDLLYACLLDWGVEIHLPHSSTDLDGCTVHNVDNGALMACFSPNVPRSVVEYMAKQQPLRAVFRDSAFASDDAKINVTEIFKNLSPDTKVKVI